MGRLLTFVMLLSCMIVIAGCHSDEKQSIKIQDKMEESASYETEFVSEQEDLNEYREKEQSIYNDLIDLNVLEEEDNYQQKLDEANAF